MCRAARRIDFRKMGVCTREDQKSKETKSVGIDHGWLTDRGRGDWEKGEERGGRMRNEYCQIWQGVAGCECEISTNGV